MTTGGYFQLVMACWLTAVKVTNCGTKFFSGIAQTATQIHFIDRLQSMQ